MVGNRGDWFNRLGTTAAGALGGAAGIAGTVIELPVTVTILQRAILEIADDEQQSMWVTGIPDKARLIVQGQDFVREDQIVEAVPAEQQSAQR